jgi:hypothetical protein
VLTYCAVPAARGSDRMQVSASEHHMVAKGAKGVVSDGFRTKNPAGQSRDCRWSTCTFLFREVMSIAGIVRAHKPARRGEWFVAGSEAVPGSCAEP